MITLSPCHPLTPVTSIWRYLIPLLTLLLSACLPGAQSQVVSASVVEAISSTDDTGFARATAPIDFVFPLDHGPHPEFRTEWWYYTGNLDAKDGRQFGYQLTIFRSALTPSLPERSSDLATNQVYMAHFAVTDAANNQHYSFDRYSRGAGNLAGATGVPQYAVWLEDWQVRAENEQVTHVQASVPAQPGKNAQEIGINLTLVQTRPPLLHGTNGLSQKGADPGNANYYYSLVHLASSGVITINGESIAVQGISWMDHEFGTSALSRDAVGWDWFSLQLAEGTEQAMALMFARIRTKEGRYEGLFQGTIGYADGRQETIKADEFTLTANAEWRSPRTDIVYPSGWRLSIPKHQIELTIAPLIADQEMKVNFVYWEGAVTTTGTMDGATIAGRGYVELTGYGVQTTEYQR